MKMIKYLLLALFLVRQLLAASLDTVVIKSESMEKAPRAVIVIPDSYHQNKTALPVLYLLHGWSGSFRDWSLHMDLRPLVERYQFIIVCPDGGYDGWYLDSPLDKTSQYETYISREVIGYIDKHYRTIAGPEGRFISGLSMGGHGALSLLAKHPDLYAAAGSMSGALALSRSSKKYGLIRLLGDPESNPELWQQNSCISLLENLAGLNRGILLDCGIDDFTIAINRTVHTKLIELGIPHDYIERPGKHNWDYWTNALEYHLLYFTKYRNTGNR